MYSFLPPSLSNYSRMPFWAISDDHTSKFLCYTLYYSSSTRLNWSFQEYTACRDQGLARNFLFRKFPEIFLYFRKERNRNIFFGVWSRKKEIEIFIFWLARNRKKWEISRYFFLFLRKKEMERNEKFLNISFPSRKKTCNKERKPIETQTKPSILLKYYTLSP